MYRYYPEIAKLEDVDSHTLFKEFCKVMHQQRNVTSKSAGNNSAKDILASMRFINFV